MKELFCRLFHKDGEERTGGSEMGGGSGLRQSGVR